jgi:Na+/proline symporter
MSLTDWLVMLGTLAFIAGYGAWKTRQSRNMDTYLRGNDMGWLGVGLSVMATQASAITFISTPGLAYESGMAFVQNYFGLPIALIVVCAVFIPMYYRLRVFTAYEYLEQRFDVRVRILTAFLFLIQRGLAAGITIYAPAIILSVSLGWHLNTTILLVGALVIFYTVMGGTRAVSVTQKWQMTVILLGMTTAFFMIVFKLPEGVSVTDALHLAGKTGRMQMVDFSWNFEKRYTFWSGIAGGFFLALSYFGTDQSQVQRYLTARNITQSRMGLIFNGLLKIPMQFFILLTGVLVFAFYQFNRHPVLFNRAAAEAARESSLSEAYLKKEAHFQSLWDKKEQAARSYVEAHKTADPSAAYWASEFVRLDADARGVRDEAKGIAIQANSSNSARDSDFVFLNFILNEMPVGLIGLLLAVILSAAMSSTSGEINALATTTVIDFYRRLGHPALTEKQEVRISKWFTLAWGLLAVSFALFAGLVENLIEAVNILGSIFYGTILGIFTTAFFMRKCGSNSVLAGAGVAQVAVIFMFVFLEDRLGYLWYNFIGCLLVMAVAWMVSSATETAPRSKDM